METVILSEAYVKQEFVAEDFTPGENFGPDVSLTDADFTNDGSLSIKEEDDSFHIKVEEVDERDVPLTETESSIYENRARKLRLYEIIDELEEIQDNLERSRPITGVDVVLLPPENSQDTDEDSGDEEFFDPERFPHRQLQAESELTLFGNDTRRDIAVFDELPGIADSASGFPSPLLRPETPVCASNPTTPPPTTSGRRRLIFPQVSQQPSQPLQSPLPAQAVLSSRKNRKWIKADLEMNNLGTNKFIPPLSLSEASDPLYFFQLFFDEEIVDTLVKFTSEYAEKSNDINFSVTKDEMYCFVAVLFLSGYVPVSRRRMFWEDNEDTKNILVARSIRRNQFEKIFKNFHAADNDYLDESDRFAKVAPIANLFNKNFLKYVPIQAEISVDETMIPYYGRHPYKQFIRGKPIRFGFKAWSLCNSNGYCISFYIYQGRSGPKTSQMGLGESVVVKFATLLKENYPDHNFSFFTDDFFTSPKLISYMGKIGYKLTGTVRANQTENCPLKDVKSFKKMPRGAYEHKFSKNESILAVRWNDNAAVTVMSNESGVEPLQKVRRYDRKEKKKVLISQPYVIARYNRFMGGVDLLDNFVSTYRISFQGKKWYIPLCFWMFDVAMVNAWLLSKSFGMTLDQLTFRRRVVVALLQQHGKPPLSRGRGSGSFERLNVEDPVRFSGTDHLILTEQQRRRCRQCKNKTTKACSKCLVALHDKCFLTYHSK